MFVSVTKNDDPVQENLESAPFMGGILVEGGILMWNGPDGQQE